MARNYSKETAWEKEKYGILHVKLDKTLVEEFRKRLADESITCAEWMRQHIRKYLTEHGN